MPESDPRLRLPLVLIAAFVAITLPDPRSATLGLAIAVAGIISWGCIDRVVGFRWMMLALLLAITAAPLPFTIAGEARWWIGPFPLTVPGIDLALTWWCRGMAAGGLVLSLLAPLPLWRILQAAGWWRCPQTLLVIILLVHRHGSALAAERRRLAEAAALRGWHLSPRPRPLAQLGGMLGALIVRTERRATSISESMALRGFDGRIPQPQWNRLGYVRVVTAFILAIALIGGGVYPWLSPS